MKKLVSILVAFIIGITCLAACNNKKTIEANNNKEKKVNPFDLEGNNEIYDISYSFGPVRIEENSFEFNGKFMERDYEYINESEVKCNFGFMMFIDGIPQSYKVNEKEEEKFMHTFDVEKKSREQFKVSLNPSVGKNGDILGLYVVSIFNPNFSLNKNLKIIGHNYALAQALPIDIKYKESSNVKKVNINDKYMLQQINEKIKEKYYNKDKNNKCIDPKEQRIYLNYNKDYKEMKILCKSNSKVNLTLEGLGIVDECKYRTTIFIDNKPVKTSEGEDYLDMELKKGSLSKQSFNIDTRNLKGVHSLYTISVPVGDNYKKITSQVIQSEPKLLIIEE